MVLGFCPAPHCHPSIYQVSFKNQQYLVICLPDGQTKQRLYASLFGEHNKMCTGSVIENKLTIYKLLNVCVFVCQPVLVCVNN